MFGKVKRLFCLVCAISVLLSFAVAVQADNTTKDSTDSGVNRFNVVLVLDASGSMIDTDPEEYRYDALEQFNFLLADSGNYLGCVVFDTYVKAQHDLTAVNGQTDKDEVLETLKSYKPQHGYTNIGDALLTAVDMIQNEGKPDLPSVIVFLSDGNTEMPKNTSDALENSLEAKAAAIEYAREDGISIYSVCLNADGNADISEMQQISDATGGVCNEVNDAEDLQDVLATFYSLIYKTVPIPVDDEEFPENGIITKTYDIPGLGVEEVNFMLYGSVDSVKVYDPSGKAYQDETMIKPTCAMTKVMNPLPGKCTVELHGEPGTTIYGNMVYNVNLFMVGNSDLQQMTGSDQVPVNFSLQLGTGKVLAADPAQYNGFSADLIISDAYQREIETVPMTIGDKGFEVAKKLDEGVYFYKFRVTGFSLDKATDNYGPFTIVHTEPNPTAIPTPPPNTAPEPVQDEVSFTKYVIPFLDNTLTIPVSNLATDAEDSNLYYQLESSSFIDGTDYKFDGNTITMTHYSLSKGDYIIKATDTGGLSCKIKVKVTAINVGLIAVITVGSIGLLILAAALFSLWYWKLRPLRGILTVVDPNNVEKTTNGGHGQLRLSRLANNCAGFDSKKAYIQCTGRNYVYFKSNKKFIAKSREPVKKIKIPGTGNPVIVRLPESDAAISFVFQPTVRNSSSRGKSRGRGTGRGSGRATPVRPRSGGGRPVRSAPPRSSGGRGLRR